MENNKFNIKGKLVQCDYSTVGKYQISVTDAIIQVRRQFPCSNGYYEYDNFPVEFWRNQAEEVQHLIGETIDVQGRISIGKNLDIHFLAEKYSIIEA